MFTQRNHRNDSSLNMSIRSKIQGISAGQVGSSLGVLVGSLASSVSLFFTSHTFIKVFLQLFILSKH